MNYILYTLSLFSYSFFLVTAVNPGNTFCLDIIISNMSYLIIVLNFICSDPAKSLKSETMKAN